MVLTDAHPRRKVVEATLSAELNGLVLTDGVAATPMPTVMPKTDGTTVSAAVTAYLDDLRLSKRPHKSIQGKQKDLDLVMAVCSHVTQVDLVEYVAY